MNNSYTLWYCYDNTDWRIWGRYEHEHLAERAREELKTHERPYDSTQPYSWESYLWTVILNPGEEPPQNMTFLVDHDSFEELFVEEPDRFGDNVEDS